MEVKMNIKEKDTRIEYHIKERSALEGHLRDKELKEMQMKQLMSKTA